MNARPDTELAAELRALAEAATPGPWRQRADTPWGSKVIVNDNGEMFLGISLHTSPPTEKWSPSARAEAARLSASKCADAAFIAATDPTTVLALLDRIEVLAGRVAELEQQLAAATSAGNKLAMTMPRSIRGRRDDQQVALEAWQAFLAARSARVWAGEQT